MSNFNSFQREVKDILAKHQYSIDNIEYINLSSKFCVTANAFFTLNGEPPGLEDAFRQILWSKTWMVPDDFCIVMKDCSFFIYIMVHDEFYNHWYHVKPCVKSPIEMYVSSNNEVSYINRRI
jgi:hypothetical protein